MPDPIVATDALPAGSSPAADLVPAESTDALDGLSAADLQTWRETGVVPASPVTTPIAASSAATPVQDPAVSTETPPQPAGSDPAAPTPGADKRIPELLADRARERERADRAERRLADLERPRQPIPDARPAASSAAPAGPTRPDPETFPYGTADPAYLEALADFKVDTRLAAERATWEEGQRQSRAREESTRVMAAFEARRVAATVKHPDFDAVAMLAPTEIPQGSALDLFILEDNSGAEVLYHLQQAGNAVERKRLIGLSALDQIKEAVRLGDRLTAPDPTVRTTNAPPPPPILSTRATPADAVDRALADGDSDEATGAYIAARNRDELARLKR